jgi:hypothetical protein
MFLTKRLHGGNSALSTTCRATIKFVGFLHWTSNIKNQGKMTNTFAVVITNIKNMYTPMHDFSQRATSTMCRSFSKTTNYIPLGFIQGTIMTLICRAPGEF